MSDADVIDLVSDSDVEEVEEIDADGWMAIQGGGAGGVRAGAGARGTQEEDDEAMALRLQEEEYRGGPVAPPRAAAAAHTLPDEAEPVTELDWSRRYRSEQDAAYEASLAADRQREAAARAAAQAAEAAAAEAAAAEAAAAAAAAAAEAQARDAEAAKQRARDAWTATPEPAAGGAGVICCALRYPDGSRVTRRFAPGTPLASLFECADALGPLPYGAAFSLATGFPRRVLARPAGGSGGDTLEACGLDASASVMVVPSD